MLYRYALTVPANTSESMPERLVVPVTHGVLRHVSVSFPPGAAGLAHVAVLYHGHQIIPVNMGEYLAWDDVTLAWPEEMEVSVPPFEFTLVGWSEDELYSHTVVFRFDIIPVPRRPADLLRRLAAAMGVGT